MNTIFIYDNANEDNIMFFVKDGDYRHLNGIYLGARDESDPEDVQTLKDELFSLLAEADICFEFPVHRVGANTEVIVVGYLS